MRPPYRCFEREGDDLKKKEGENMGRREKTVKRERNIELNIKRREKMLNKKLFSGNGICVHTVSYLRRYCSMF